MNSSQFVNKRVKIREPDFDFNDLSATIGGQVIEKEGNKLSIKLKEGLSSDNEDQIQVIYIDNAQGIYYFNGNITSINGQGDLIKVECPAEVSKHQQREAVRVEYKTEIEFFPVSYKGEDLTHLEDKKGSGQMIDISAGGLSFISNIKLLKELVIELTFKLGEQSYQVLGEIVRIIEMDEGYEMGIKFDYKLKSIESDICSFVLKQQLRNRRKQMGG